MKPTKFDWIQFLVICSLVLYISAVIQPVFKYFGEQQFTYLSKSFTEGKSDLNDYPYNRDDMALFKGNYYWPLGPFPAVLHIPFTWVSNISGYPLYQKDIQWIFVFLVFYLIYEIAIKLGYSKRVSVLWAFVFCVGSAFLYVSIIPFSWYFSHVVTTLLIFLSFYEYLGRKRYFLIGLFYAAILLTRVTAAVGLLFYLYSIIVFDKNDLKNKMINILKLTAPVIVGVVLIGIYNFLRFGNAFEQGYAYQLLNGGALVARNYGIFSPIHIPGNLYYLFLAAPIPVLKDGISKVLTFPYLKSDMFGMGMFFTSPYLLNLFALNFKSKFSKILIIVSVITAVPIVFYYGIGAVQYGYRYSLDFLPFLFLVLMDEHKDKALSDGFKLLLLFSIFFNIYLIFT